MLSRKQLEYIGHENTFEIIFNKYIHLYEGMFEFGDNPNVTVEMLEKYFDRFNDKKWYNQNIDETFIENHYNKVCWYALSQNKCLTPKLIDKYSAGYQVFSNIDDFNKFMEMAYKQKDLYGNKFTYTLIDERTYNKRRRRKIILISLIGFLLVGGIILTTKLIKK